MAIHTVYIDLNNGFREKDDPTHVQVKLLDVKISGGYDYTAIITVCRREEDFVHTRPFSWPTQKVVLTTVARRTAKATLTARLEFDRLLADASSPLWERVRVTAHAFGGVKESVQVA